MEAEVPKSCRDLFTAFLKSPRGVDKTSKGMPARQAPKSQTLEQSFPVVAMAPGSNPATKWKNC